jgi:hypothetical protein
VGAFEGLGGGFDGVVVGRGVHQAGDVPTPTNEEVDMTHPVTGPITSRSMAIPAEPWPRA